MYGSYIRPGHALPRVNFIHTSRGNTDGQSDRQMNTAKTTQLDMFIIYIYIIYMIPDASFGVLQKFWQTLCILFSVQK